MMLNGYCDVKFRLASLGIPLIHARCFCAVLRESVYDVFTGDFFYTGQLGRGDLFLKTLESERLVRRLDKPLHCTDADEANGRRWDPNARLGGGFRDRLVELKYAEGSLTASIDNRLLQ